MDRPLVDRRADTRFRQPAIAGMQAILRPGYAVSLVDLSSGGALIQGPRPLRPGARVHIQLVHGNQRLAMGASVLRCAVTSLEAGAGVQYRGALQFDHRCDVFWESATLDGYVLPGGAAAAARSAGHSLPDTPTAPGTGGDRQDE